MRVSLWERPASRVALASSGEERASERDGDREKERGGGGKEEQDDREKEESANSLPRVETAGPDFSIKAKEG